MTRTVRAPGFVLPALLVLLTLAALVVADALMEATTSAALATRLQLRQRAFEAAQSAEHAGEAALSSGAAVPPEHAPADSALRTRLELRRDRRDVLVPGFSAGRFTREHLRLTTHAEGPRGTRLELSGGYALWSSTP